MSQINRLQLKRSFDAVLQSELSPSSDLSTVLVNLEEQKQVMEQLLEAQSRAIKRAKHEIETRTKFQLPQSTAGISRPGASGVLGMFTHDFREQIGSTWHYKDCTFRVNINDVIKVGFIASKVRIHVDNTMEIERQGKLYKMKLGFYCADVTSSDL